MKNIITYTVNKNYENELYLSVQNGEVVIDAPWYYTKGEIQNIIEEKQLLAIFMNGQMENQIQH